MAYVFSDILTRVYDKAGVNSSDTATVAKVKRAVNDAYKAWASTKQWKELITSHTLNIKDEYTTGTVAVTNGSRTITGTSTVWTSTAHNSRILKVDGYEETYKVSAVGSGTNITADQSYNGSTATSKAYSLYQPIYSLTNTFAEFIDPHHAFWPYSPAPVSIDEMRTLYNHYPTTTGKAQYYTLFGFDSSNKKQVMIWPISDEDYNLKYDCKENITELSADGDVPLVPDLWRAKILVEGGLAFTYVAIGDPRADTQLQIFHANLRDMMIRHEPTDRISRVEVKDNYRSGQVPGNVYVDRSYFTRRRLNVP